MSRHLSSRRVGVALGSIVALVVASASAQQAAAPDDPAFAEQWSLEQPSDADIDVLGAWAWTTGEPSVVIAVLDTGLHTPHEDIAPGRVLSGYDFVNDDDDPTDDFGHGTHVTSVALAGADDGVGIAGVCPRCTLLPVKVLDHANRGDCAWWSAGIRFAVDQGAHVINLSAGTPDACPDLLEAVRYADAAGVPIVTVMGNNELVDVPIYPGAWPETIAVGATDRDDRHWVDPFGGASNVGAWIDLAAPGSMIAGSAINSTREVVFLSGTSQSAALVSGTLGLLLSVDPTLSPADLREIVRRTADDAVGRPAEDVPGFDPYHGAGRLNAAQAVRALTAPDDIDADGHPAATDCDDTNARVHPGATELPGNDLDDDCDPDTPDRPDDLSSPDLAPDAADVADTAVQPSPPGGDCCAVATRQSRHAPAPRGLAGLLLVAALLVARRRRARDS